MSKGINWFFVCVIIEYIRVFGVCILIYLDFQYFSYQLISFTFRCNSIRVSIC